MFDFRFQAEVPARLPAYPGSAWRGALGWSLKRTVCVVRNTACPDCLMYRSCVYPYVFETPPPPNSQMMRKYTAAPHPFILRIQPGQTTTEHHLGLILIGRAVRQLPYFVHALGEAARHGLGSQRTPLQLEEVTQAASPDFNTWSRIYTPDGGLSQQAAATPVPPAIPDRVSLHFETPLRLKRDKHLVTPARFRFADLFDSLLRRISMLSYFHMETRIDEDFAGLIHKAENVRHHAPRLRWYDWTRYSSRQETTLEMGGIIGSIELEGADLSEFWPWLWVGQWTHAGKGATLGLGRYTITPASLPDLQD